MLFYLGKNLRKRLLRVFNFYGGCVYPRAVNAKTYKSYFNAVPFYYCIRFNGLFGGKTAMIKGDF